MSDEAKIEPGRVEDDALAAEYVLGVLDQSERVRLSLRIERDPTFAGLVADWEARLGELDDGFAIVTPPPSVKAAVDGRLFGNVLTASKDPTATSLWGSLALWRLLTTGALIGLVVLLFVSLRAPDQPVGGQTLVASLSSDNNAARFVALYETSAHTLRISIIVGDEILDQDYELWIISGDNPPESLGLINGVGDKALRVTTPLQSSFVEGVTLAVSLEPTGGSPTGLPTGPVVAVGVVKKI